MLGIAQHFARIPQEDRKRTLTFFFDCRHFMPGQEKAFAKHTWPAKDPKLFDSVVAVIGVEHLGQVSVGESPEEPFGPRELPEFTSIWAIGSDLTKEIAVRAVQENTLSRTAVQTPGRPGIHGAIQPRAWGLAAGIINGSTLPGFIMMGGMTAYWSTKARLNYFDPGHFVDQVATLVQITHELMLVEPTRLRER